MTGVTTRHSEEPYAKSARTVLWEVRGASRAPTRSGNAEQANQALEGRQTMQMKGMLFYRPCRGLSYYCSLILGLRAASQRFTPG